MKKILSSINDIWLNRNEGTIAFVLHRLTGLCLVGYIFLHLIIVGSDFLIGKGVFNLLMGIFEIPLVKVLEICLISVITFHLINGLRIIIIDFFIGAKKQRILSWVVLVLCILFFIITVLIFLPYIIK
ncbi:MAG: succinate dehydrogenase, cytochrome b556 subunit [Planctomycetota bacterium]